MPRAPDAACWASASRPDRTAAPTPAAAPLAKKSRRLRAFPSWSFGSFRPLPRFLAMYCSSLRFLGATLIGAKLSDSRAALPLPACGERSSEGEGASPRVGASRKGTFTLRESTLVERPPHPDPLRASGEREQKGAARAPAYLPYETTCPKRPFSARRCRRPPELNATFTCFRDSRGLHLRVWHVDAPRNSRDRRGDCGSPRSLPYSSGAAPYSPLRAGWALKRLGTQGGSEPEA